MTNRTTEQTALATALRIWDEAESQGINPSDAMTVLIHHRPNPLQDDYGPKQWIQSVHEGAHRGFCGCGHVTEIVSRRYLAQMDIGAHSTTKHRRTSTAV